MSLPFAYRDGVDKYNGIMRYLRETGTDWELRVIRDSLDTERFRSEVDGSVAGVICGAVAPFDGVSRGTALLEECLDHCHARGTPLVALDWPLEAVRLRRERRASFLSTDSETVGRLAARTLLANGQYSSFGYVGLFASCAWSRDRGTFFAREVRGNGPCAVRVFGGDPLEDAEGLAEWLAALPKPAGVFAANDCAAALVLRVCARRGIRVPDDMSVLGVDDDPVLCVHTRPTLTSIHPDFERMGYLAAGELARLLRRRGLGRRLVVTGQATVTARMSTAPCSPAGRLVRRVDELIAARACEGLDSGALADELKISRRLLDLRYRQYTGGSVRKAIMRARVERACELLSGTGHSIGAISKMCGYRTASYLGRVFLEQRGMTMEEFRSRTAEGDLKTRKTQGKDRI